MSRAQGSFTFARIFTTIDNSNWICFRGNQAHLGIIHILLITVTHRGTTGVHAPRHVRKQEGRRKIRIQFITCGTYHAATLLGVSWRQKMEVHHTNAKQHCPHHGNASKQSESNYAPKQSPNRAIKFTRKHLNSICGVKQASAPTDQEFNAPFIC